MSDEETKTKLTEIDLRLRNVESWRATSEAVQEVRREHMDKRFDSIDAQLATFRSHFMKVIWAVVALVIAGIGNFVIQGGLTLVPQ